MKKIKVSAITIDLVDSRKTIKLTGDINSIYSNRYVLRYLKDFFYPTFENDCVKIPIRESPPEEVITKIRAMLKKYGFEELRSSSTEQVLSDYYEQEEKFNIFSRQALNIRNNNCSIDQLKSFTFILEKYLKGRTLYPLQLLSAYHLAFSQNACNFSVPGSGKTSIVYGAYAYLKNIDDDAKKINRLLVIGPLSSFGPWELEYEECFGAKPIAKRLVGSLSREEKISYLYSQHPAELTLISYASVPQIKDDLIRFLRNHEVMVVLDEAHKIKNTTGGITANAVLDIAQYCRSRVVLTGTPAPNGYEDLYNLFNFIWPYKNIIKFQVNQLKDMSGRRNDPRVGELLNSIAPFFIRIRKSDLRLPPVTVHPPIITEMGPIQRKIYSFIEKKYIEGLIDGKDLISKFQSQLVKAKIVRLMQAASNPALLNFPLQEFLGEGYPEASHIINDLEIVRDIASYQSKEIPSKFFETLKLVKNLLNRGHKVIIWASFIQTIHFLKDYLASHDINSQVLYGAIPVERNGEDVDELTREKIIAQFHNEDCPYKVIIANPFAVSESISLHKACHHAIYVERTFNAAHFMQSKDRIHRYGLKPTDETNYYFILSRDTIDEVIDKRLSEKEKRMIEVTESMPIPLFDNLENDLGDEDIKALIKDYVKRTKKIL